MKLAPSCTHKHTSTQAHRRYTLAVANRCTLSLDATQGLCAHKCERCVSVQAYMHRLNRACCEYLKMCAFVCMRASVHIQIPIHDVLCLLFVCPQTHTLTTRKVADIICYSMLYSIIFSVFLLFCFYYFVSSINKWAWIMYTIFENIIFHFCCYDCCSRLLMPIFSSQTFCEKYADDSKNPCSSQFCFSLPLLCTKKSSYVNMEWDISLWFYVYICSRHAFSSSASLLPTKKKSKTILQRDFTGYLFDSIWDLVSVSACNVDTNIQRT